LTTPHISTSGGRSPPQCRQSQSSRYLAALHTSAQRLSRQRFSALAPFPLRRLAPWQKHSDSGQRSHGKNDPEPTWRVRCKDPQPTLILRRDSEAARTAQTLSGRNTSRCCPQFARISVAGFVARKQIDRRHRGCLLERSIMFYDCRNCAHLCCINGARPILGASMSVVLQSFLSGTWQQGEGVETELMA